MARILFGFAGGIGHLLPMAPIARAAQAAGHIVAVAGRPQHAAEVEALGLEAIPIGSDADEPDARTRLRRLSQRREDLVLREGFARRIARERVTALLPLAERWRPDVLVCDEVDWGGMLAAERLGLPHANVLVLAAGSFARRSVVAEPLAELRADLGLAPDPELAMLDRDLMLSPFPPSFRDPASPLPTTAHAIRPTGIAEATDAERAAWRDDQRDAPVVYVTLGTVFNLESGDLFERIFEGLGGLPLQVVATVGRQLDPAALAEVPDNVRVERYVPQSLLLPRCDAVVCHGGSGSVTGALLHGLPMVVLPMGADQPMNAARCETLGVGRTLDALHATPADIGGALAAVLRDPTYRDAAVRMQAEISSLPDAAHAVRLLEGLLT
ncbi:MAG: glycosyltransferase [Actinomycetota bacterium]